MRIMKNPVNARQIANRSLTFLAFFLIFVISSQQSAHALTEQKIVWSAGQRYTLTPTSNAITVGNYTIKALDFASSVPGITTHDGTVIPEAPVIPSVYIGIYNNLINKTSTRSQYPIRF